ncbi:MAG: hypothetical protein FWF28_10075 [Micrococcales bacterium]|nr:hypothetical protein [Micrococcales bacterium]
MAIFTLACATGAPGVTTTALGLTLAWPRDAVLIDADRTASQAVLAGYLTGTSTGGRGLTSLAQAYRDGTDLASDLPSHMLPIAAAQKSAGQRWFVPGFARPGSSRLFEPVWPELASALAELDRQGIDAILDAGRWGAQGLPPAVLAHSRWLGVVTRSTLRSLAALRLYMPDVNAATGAQPGCATELVVVRPGTPYPVAEIGEHFGWTVNDVPWQPDDAAQLSEGASGRLRTANRPLARAYAVLAAHLLEIADRWNAKIDPAREAVAHV